MSIVLGVCMVASEATKREWNAPIKIGKKYSITFFMRLFFLICYDLLDGIITISKNQEKGNPSCPYYSLLE
jgi:hypothetical protein